MVKCLNDHQTNFPNFHVSTVLEKIPLKFDNETTKAFIDVLLMFFSNSSVVLSANL